MKVTRWFSLAQKLLVLVCAVSALELTLDLPSGEKTINFDIKAMEHYNPKPYMKKMLKLERKYIDCLHMKGIRHESFIECAGEGYSKIIEDYLDLYFEFLKEVNHYINEQKVILCKSHYSRFCPDIDMFMREQLSSENLRKETFVRVFKGLELSKEFRTRAYYDYLRHLFKGIDELVEMRKLAVSYMTMAAKHCQEFIRNFKFLHLDYDAGNLERIKHLMQKIDAHPSSDFIEQLDKGIKKVGKGETISRIPNMEIWGGEDFQKEDSDSLPDTHGSGPQVQIGDQVVHLDKDSSNVRDDSFNNSVLREKEYMTLLKNLQARGNLKMEGHVDEQHGGSNEKSLFDRDMLNSYVMP